MATTINLDTIIWKAEYNIGDLKIDQEHQSLFLIARRALTVRNMHDREKEKDKLKDIITELFEYVGKHFKNEQQYMQSINYPELLHHKNIHLDMLNSLKSLTEEINTLNIEQIEIKLYSFINEYFIKHIMTEDKKIQLWSLSLEELRKTFGWKDIYSIHNTQIDNEHKHLFDIAQDAFEVVDNEHRFEKIKSILFDLYDYMKNHFKHEEEYMLALKYPRLEEHKKIHAGLIEELNILIKKLPSFHVLLFEKELARIIDILLVQHIIQEDKKIMDWFNHHKEI